MDELEIRGAAGSQRSRDDKRGRIAWFHCFSGIAGDMALGSLVDAGADPSELEHMVERLPIDGWSLSFETVWRGGIAATRAVVRVRDDAVVRTFPHVMAILEEARLPVRVRERSAAAFSLLASVEGRLHRRPTSQVHFHELGGHDTIVEVVGTASALELLGVRTVSASSVATGRGMVRTPHGLVPNPGPAVVELLEGIPTHGRDTGVELTTPTGAAMLAAWGSAFGPMPAMTIESAGYGAGARDLDEAPNCTQVVIGRRADSAAASPFGQQLVKLEARLADLARDAIHHALQALVDEGALDVFMSPVHSESGEPGFVVNLVCDPVLVGDIRQRLKEDLGVTTVTVCPVELFSAEDGQPAVDVDGHRVRVQVSPGRVRAERADVARVAEITGAPLREVVTRAEAAWKEPAGTTETPPPSEPGTAPITPMRP